MVEPDFICIGAQKAGTAWLSQCLQAHPYLWNPGIKELHFFDKASSTDDKKNPLSVALTKRHLKKIEQKAKSGKFLIRPELSQAIIKSKQITYQDYLNFFALAPNNSKTWEITPSYGSMSIQKIEKMNELLPHTKYLYIVRDPISRALSSLRMTIERGVKKGEEQSTIIDRWLSQQLNGGRYSKHIPKMNKILGDNQKIIYLPFGLIKTKPLQFLRSLETFIGIPESNYSNVYSTQYHKTNKSVNIPPKITALVENELENEKDFLQSFFDGDFVNNCL